MNVKVLGTNCPKCKETERVVREAVLESRSAVNVEKISDMTVIAGYGVSGTPAVVVDGQVKSAGRVPSKSDVKSWIGAVP